MTEWENKIKIRVHFVFEYSQPFIICFHSKEPETKQVPVFEKKKSFPSMVISINANLIGICKNLPACYLSLLRIEKSLFHQNFVGIFRQKDHAVIFSHPHGGIF